MTLRNQPRKDALLHCWIRDAHTCQRTIDGLRVVVQTSYAKEHASFVEIGAEECWYVGLFLRHGTVAHIIYTRPIAVHRWEGKAVRSDVGPVYHRIDTS